MNMPYLHLVRRLADRLSVLLARIRFPGSAQYWDLRYRLLGTSGSGSYGAGAQIKAEFLNRFIAENEVETVLEIGCGDGAQLGLYQFESYTGVDVSAAAVRICSERFKDDDKKRFITLDQLSSERADLVLSADVVYHLVENWAFERHMEELFTRALRFVVIYSTNHSQSISSHVRHRQFVPECSVLFNDFDLITRPDHDSSPQNPNSAFYVFRRR